MVQRRSTIHPPPNTGLPRSSHGSLALSPFTLYWPADTHPNPEYGTTKMHQGMQKDAVQPRTDPTVRPGLWLCKGAKAKGGAQRDKG